ncbi:MAG: hypothetical protein PHN88_02820 [Ignavibacteria bacterium]|nr:hypothetical protein [Ignavibacteria bacterium]
MNISKTTTAVDPNGGAILIIKSNAAGAQPTINMGFIADSEFKDVTSQKDLDEESGNTFMTINEKRTVTLDTTLWQSDTNMINAIDEMRNGSYTLAWKKSVLLNQWIIANNATIKPDFNFKTGDGKIKITWNIAENQTAWTLSGTALTAAVSASGFGISGTTATAATIAVGAYYTSLQ